MKSGPFTHTIAVLLSSVSACFAPSALAQVPTKKVQLNKKQNRLTEDVLFKVDPVGYTPPGHFRNPMKGGERFPWKTEIVTTVFWIGENPTANNPVPNHASSWDAAVAAPRLHPGEIHTPAKSVLLRAALQRQSARRSSIRGAQGGAVV